MTDSDEPAVVRFDPETSRGFQSADPDVRCDRPLHPELEQHFEGKMYGHLKGETADAVVALLEPIRRASASCVRDEAIICRPFWRLAHKRRVKG